MRFLALAVGLLVVACSDFAFAQPRLEQWGVSAGFSPSWRADRPFKVVFDADDLVLQGSEVRIGFVRGRILEGDWGVSFIRKKIEAGSKLDADVGRACQGCGVFYTTTETTDVTGVEVHRFVPFTTIQDRVQIGLNLAIGAGWLQGEVQKRSVLLSGAASVEQVSQVKATELFPPRDTNLPLPIGKIEVAVGVILGPGLKVRASGGLNFPGTQVISVSAVYLFGAS